MPMLSSSFGAALTRDGTQDGREVLQCRRSRPRPRTMAREPRERAVGCVSGAISRSRVLLGSGSAQRGARRSMGRLDARWNWHPTLERIIGEPSVPAEPSVVHFSGNLKPWSHHGLGTITSCISSISTRPPGRRPARCNYLDRAVARRSLSLRRLLPAEQWGMRLTRAVTWEWADEHSRNKDKDMNDLPACRAFWQPIPTKPSAP